MNDLFDRTRPHDAREGLFGGRATVRVWDLDPRPLAPFAAILACELEPSGSVGAHVQQECPEIVLGISGVGRASVNGVWTELQAGAVVQLPWGATLSIENSSTSDALCYLIIKAHAPRA
ncbi:MAG: cupin domain-containing protein [Polyangiaceae bacterium]